MKTLGYRTSYTLKFLLLKPQNRRCLLNATQIFAGTNYTRLHQYKPDGQTKSLDDRHRQVNYSSLKKNFDRVGFLYRVLAKLEK